MLLCVTSNMPRTQASDRAASYSSLQTWFIEKGGKIHPSIVVCESLNSAGLCLHPIPQRRAMLEKTTPWLGESGQLIVIPRQLLITANVAARLSRVAAGILHAWHPQKKRSNMHRKLQEVILAVFILEEQAKGKASKWFPYIEALPNRKSMRNQLPVMWSREEREIGLGRSHMVEVLSTLRSAMEYSYTHAVCPISPAFCKQVQLGDYLWALSLVQTRAFSLGEHDELTMVPFGDMINHKSISESPDTVWKESTCEGMDRESECGNLTFFGEKSLLQKPGSEIFSHYGSMDAAKTFSVFGFIDDTSIWRATIVFEFNENKPQTKQSIPRGSIYRHAFQLTTEVDDQAMDMLRLVSTSILSNQTRNVSYISYALDMLLNVITNHLRNVEISDEDALKIEGGPTVYRHALRYRRGEAHVLSFWQNLVKSALAIYKERRASMDSGSHNRREVNLEVGSSAYLNYMGGDFHLVRVVSIRDRVDGEQLDPNGLKMYDVQFFPSGTKIIGLSRGELLDEASFLLFLASSV